MQQYLVGACSDLTKFGEQKQHQTGRNIEWEICSCCNWDYKVGDQVFLGKNGILCKDKGWYECDPWTITSVDTKGTIRVQCKTKSE